MRKLCVTPLKFTAVVVLFVATTARAGSPTAADPSTFAPMTFSLQDNGSPQDNAATTEGGTYEETTVITSAANPFSFNITYYLYSDYVFRGINLSEYSTEGRERLNHQMSTDVSVDLGTLFGAGEGAYGTFSFGTFFEWFAGQKSLDPELGGQNAQEIDYILSWSYDWEPIATTTTLAFTFYAFPNATGINTQDWSITFEHNDAWLWKGLWPDNEDGVLNPWFTYVQDVGLANGGSWMEMGINHDFALTNEFTLTPSFLLAIDHRYLDPIVGTGRNGTTRLAYWQIGLTAAYDLTPLLQLPEWAGSVELAGFLYYNDALGTAESDDTIQDEFFGGMSLGWSF